MKTSEHQTQVTLASFYKFTPIRRPRDAGEEWKAKALSLGLKGTIIAAKEGVNSAVTGAADSVGAFLAYVETTAGELMARFTHVATAPFGKLVLKIRSEIVTFGPRVELALNAGRFLTADAAHELAASNRALFLDTRNRYESAVGTFRGALTPDIDSFREFPRIVDSMSPHKERPIVAFCTGGIRCEKAVPYLVERGFKNVFQIKGGILAYLDAYPNGAFDGQCFVFDERCTIKSDGSPGAVRR